MPLLESDLEHILAHFGAIDGYEILPIKEVHGFQGAYYNIKISSNDQISTYFIKTIPEGSETVKEFYLRSGIFKKEVALYTRILTVLDEQKLGKLWPKCHVGEDGKYLVLEDLKDGGWKMTKTMDFIHIKTALNGLATFHATSLAAVSKQHFQLLTSSILEETMFSEDADRPGRQMWDSFCRIADEILPGRDVFRILQNVVEKVKTSKEFQNCVNHGDPWMNNMFFKYINGNPVDVVFVDFQSARYAPPALDLAIFVHIFSPGNADELAQIYYENLERCLEHATPLKSEFLKSFEYYKETGMSIAALYVFLTRLPDKYLSEILVSQDTFIPFALGRDYTPALRAIEEDPSYRNDVVEALQRVVSHHSHHAG